MTSRSGLVLSGIAPKLSPIGLDLAVEQSGWYPAQFFLTEPCVVVNQGEILPCCVSCAIATCVEVLNPTCDQLAPLFHFHMFNCTRLDCPPETFEGMTLVEGLNMLARFGICLYQYYPAPYSIEGAKAPPDEQAKIDALARGKQFAFGNIFERLGFAHLSDDNRVSEWKKALLGNRPILIGFYQTDQYGPEMDRLQGNPKKDRTHAVAVLGYRESERSFLVQDSRGKDFGRIPKNPGRWWLPYDMVEGGGNVVEEAYVVGGLPSQ